LSKKFLLSLIILANFQFVRAQTGGKSVYSFLNLPASARVAALGGNLVSANDDDVSNGYNNPALLNPSMHNHVSLSAASLFAGARYGYVAYVYNNKKLGTMSGGILFSDYGKFDYTDTYAEPNGSVFYAADYNLVLGWAKPIDSLFTVGVNLKTIYSVYEMYRSVALAADIGVAYTSKDKSFTSALLMKSVGRQIKPFVEDHPESLPFDIQFGLSKKFAHVPFRFFLTADHLTKYDLTYYDGSVSSSSGIGLTSEPQDSSILDKALKYSDRIMRHLVLGGEMKITKNFNLKIGYNYLRRKELGLSSKMGTIGFSWGFGFDSSKFSLAFGRATYHQAGATNNLTVSLKISEFRKKN
jgi:hypothetical protein